MEPEQRAELKRRAKEASDFLAAGILVQGGQREKAQAIVDRQPPTARAAVPTPPEIDTTKLSNAELESLSNKLIAEEVRRQDEGTMPRSAASSSKQAEDISDAVDDWPDTDYGDWLSEEADEDE
jgi:hypothetical protein